MTDHIHDMSDWPFPCATNAIAYCTGKVAHNDFPILRVSHDVDGDWQFLDATSDEPDECVLMCLGCILERDPTLAQNSDLPKGWSAYREEIGGRWERWHNAAELEVEEHCDTDESDAKALSDVAAYGLHIIHVGEGDDSPPFSYSIGIEKSLGLPDLIVIGLKAEVAQSAINECYRQMKAGTPITPGTFVGDLLGGDFKCLIGEVSPSNYRAYMGWALWLYGGTSFRAYQILFPSTEGVFPWEPESGEWFKNYQPLLAEPAMPGPA
jgi:hypothetical protein